MRGTFEQADGQECADAEEHEREDRIERGAAQEDGGQGRGMFTVDRELGRVHHDDAQREQGDRSEHDQV